MPDIRTACSPRMPTCSIRTCSRSSGRDEVYHLISRMQEEWVGGSLCRPFSLFRPELQAMRMTALGVNAVNVERPQLGRIADLPVTRTLRRFPGLLLLPDSCRLFTPQFMARPGPIAESQACAGKGQSCMSAFSQPLKQDSQLRLGGERSLRVSQMTKINAK